MKIVPVKQVVKKVNLHELSPGDTFYWPTNVCHPDLMIRGHVHESGQWGHKKRIDATRLTDGSICWIGPTELVTPVKAHVVLEE